MLLGALRANCKKKIKRTQNQEVYVYCGKMIAFIHLYCVIGDQRGVQVNDAASTRNVTVKLIQYSVSAVDKPGLLLSP